MDSSYVFPYLNFKEKRLTATRSVNSGIDDYSALHRKQNLQDRLEQYASLVNHYYDLATVFYEWGWGSSFHFSFQYPHESFGESIRRHEYQLASNLVSSLYGKASTKVLDVGCGIAGPARAISKFLQTHVTGITLNDYQVQRGNELNASDKNADVISVQGDFMQLPFDDNEFDGAYAIEATCHAPDRVDCYKQIFRVLKPGCVFAVYEWCMTDKFDANNLEHQRLKKDIEEGNGLPDIIDYKMCLKALEDAGFEVLTSNDQATVPNVQKWETPLLPSWSPFTQRFQFNWLGAQITNIVIYTMELLWIAPKGTVKTQKVLQKGGFALKDAAQAEIFTTMFLMVGRKPLN
jgi:sterol 24-C-methyltransferase